MTFSEADEEVEDARTVGVDDRAEDVLCSPVGERLTLREFVEGRYGAYRAEKRPKSWATERPTRSGGYWGYILQQFGDYELEDLDAVSFHNWLDGLKKQNGEPFSYNTRRLIRSAYRGALQQAVQWGLLEDVHRFFRLERHKKPTPVETLTLEEVTRLLEASSPRNRALWGMGIGCALRPSELVRCRWEHLDWEAESYAIDGTKTVQSAGVIPLMPIARESLLSYWELRGRPTEGWMFLTRDGQPYADGQGIKRALANSVRKARIRKKVTPYTLRHTGATLMLESGMSEYDVAKIMRHTSLQMLKRHYDHASALRCRTLGAAPRLSTDPGKTESAKPALEDMDAAELAQLMARASALLQSKVSG